MISSETKIVASILIDERKSLVVDVGVPGAMYGVANINNITTAYVTEDILKRLNNIANNRLYIIGNDDKKTSSEPGSKV